MKKMTIIVLSVHTGSFCRRFSLPDTADNDNIKATGSNGMLNITVGKKTPSEAKTIKVNNK